MAEAEAATTKKEHNTVHDDAIWRQLIKYELDWARNWERKWGFMKDAHHEKKKVSVVISTFEEQSNRPLIQTARL